MDFITISIIADGGKFAIARSRKIKKPIQQDRLES